jgi:hypothetical protein
MRSIWNASALGGIPNIGDTFISRRRQLWVIITMKR